MGLRFEDRPDGRWIYSGDALIGSIHHVPPDALNREIAGKWAWDVSHAVSARHLPFKLSGARATEAEATRAAEQAWRRWLDHMGLAFAKEAAEAR